MAAPCDGFLISAGHRGSRIPEKGSRSGISPQSPANGLPIPMRDPFTIAGQIEQLVEMLGGAAICGDCITDRLDLSVRSQANAVTRVMEGEEAFVREKGRCIDCARNKIVVRLRR
ncbi:hypothetical protein ACT17R_00170 [Sphingopyxis sp. Q841]|uniref:hypothetical protein n=1 Tax=Sphingopyxis sp. Q841 TaxID=3458250 RepID=UPI004035BBBF